MNILDWVVLLGTLLFIVTYGIIRSRGSKNIESYLKGGNTLKWGTIGLSVMATQASAITFLSTPGQAYESGMAFVQNYLGLPIALVIVCIFFIPLFYRLKVFTAYEYLESRFDLKTRLLGAFIFVLQRGLQAGITIYAPAIILSTMLGLPLNLTILVVGGLVIIYTVSGGTKAVSLTQKYQMGVIFLGMFFAFYLIIDMLPETVSFGSSLQVAGKLGKLDAIDFSFDISKRYTFWSGITGGLFLSLSYFGTDQSQVQRYISGKNITESRMGLMFNAILKIPMQFFILLTGVMVFMFYQFEKPPVFFKEAGTESIQQSRYAQQFEQLDDEYTEVFNTKREVVQQLATELDNGTASQALIEQAQQLQAKSQEIRSEVKELLLANDPEYETKDSDYVFLTFIITYLPHGIIGLLLAVIFSAAMSSTSSELNALGTTSTVDFYKRFKVVEGSDRHYLQVSKLLTLLWGLIAIAFALFASQAENLIEAINIVASLFYGAPLGIFLVAFMLPYVKGTAVFVGALLAELFVLILHFLTTQGIISLGYLWYNVVGLILVILFSLMIQFLINKKAGS